MKALQTFGLVVLAETVLTLAAAVVAEAVIHTGTTSKLPMRPFGDVLEVLERDVPIAGAFSRVEAAVTWLEQVVQKSPAR